MNRRLLFVLISVLCLGCIEPYEFVVKDNEPSLVVQGYISNVSYNESMQYPSDGRYFTIKLGYSSDVINKKGTVATNANIHLEDKSGNTWAYSESGSEAGTYLLRMEDFEAVEGESYKLKIILANEEIYESDWQSLPLDASPSVGNIGFEEVEKQVYTRKAGEKVVESIPGINVFVEVPKNETGEPLYYLWSFEPTWVYIAPLARSIEANYKCWANSKHFLSDYALQKDNFGGYRKELFFMETIRNERIFEELSVLVVQQTVSEDYFYFWKEMKEQVESGGVFTTPPYNLQTNIVHQNGDRKVSGYFGVVSEKAKRWYFKKEDLSYEVENTLKADCQVRYGPGGPAEECLSCLAYPKGITSNVEPVWWGQK